MTSQEPLRPAATLFVPSADSSALRARLVEDLERHVHCEVAENGDVLLSSELGRSRLTLEAAGLRIAAESQDLNGLAYIKMVMAEHVLKLGDTSLELKWSGAGAAGSPLPFFRKMTVVDSLTVGRFRRLTLRGEDLDRFTRGGLHVRLLLPPEGVTQRWPVTGDDGRPFWPDDNPPPARVYTLRRIDAGAGEVEIDMLLHATEQGAPGADFAARAGKGEVIGMTGPGGGDLPEATDYLFFADETGLPAIARMLAEMPEGCRVQAFIEVSDSGDCQELPSAATTTVTWLYRKDGASLEAAAGEIDKESVSSDAVIWGGMEHAARRIIYRRACDAWGLSRDRLRLASYWRRGKAGANHHDE